MNQNVFVVNEVDQVLRARLEEKLLALGGKRVVWREREPDLADLVEHGQEFSEPVKMRRGQRSACHLNAANLWGKDVDGTCLVSGYGLSVDQLWRQHSWVVQKGVLVETTVFRGRA